LAVIEGNNPVNAPKDVTVKYGVLDASGVFVVGPGQGLNVGNSLAPGGSESTGIQADNRGNGNASIDASGNITGVVGSGSSGFYGLIAHAGDSEATGVAGTGDALVHYQSGTINVSGSKPRGIVAWAEGDGSATVITEPGTTIIVSSSNPGDSSPTQPDKAAISVQLDSATAVAGRAITVTVASTITNSGTAAANPDFFSNPVGIRTLSYADAPTTVTYTGPGITTHGGGGAGIMALSGAGSITVKVFGPIDTTDGSSAVGILVDSRTILSRSRGLLTDTSTIRRGSALSPTAATGSVQVNVASKVSTQGEFGTAISATSGGDVAVNIAQNGLVMGGWQADRR
jgi:hypothetical protein